MLSSRVHHYGLQIMKFALPKYWLVYYSYLWVNWWFMQSMKMLLFFQFFEHSSIQHCVNNSGKQAEKTFLHFLTLRSFSSVDLTIQATSNLAHNQLFVSRPCSARISFSSFVDTRYLIDFWLILIIKYVVSDFVSVSCFQLRFSVYFAAVITSESDSDWFLIDNKVAYVVCVCSCSISYPCNVLVCFAAVLTTSESDLNKWCWHWSILNSDDCISKLLNQKNLEQYSVISVIHCCLCVVTFELSVF